MSSYTVTKRGLTIGEKKYAKGDTVTMDQKSGDALVVAGRLSANRDTERAPLEFGEPVAMPNTTEEAPKAKSKAKSKS